MPDDDLRSSGDRRPLVGASWKMHLTASEVAAYLDILAPEIVDIADRDLFVLPAFPAIPAARARLDGTNVAWGAQDVHPADHGAHTGDVSAPMLADLGCRYVEVGHHERVRNHGETHALTAAKAAAALRWGMQPIVCVGEVRRGDPAETAAALTRDLEVILADVSVADLPRVILAYEPAWAIGEGASAAPVDEVGAVHRGLRAWLDARAPVGRSVRIIYGGSVGLDNAPALLAQAAVDGLFIGRRALDPLVLAAIARTRILGR